MIDAHVHVTPQLLPHLQSVQCIANADSPEEYACLKALGLPCISAGIHPWKADTVDREQMEAILREVPVIGEIGLDSVWCNVEADVQRTVFRRQLELAAALGKPVILHTKGMEREVLEIIRNHPNRYLVHWYACPDYLADYIALDCWFTVGPAVHSDPHVKALAETVPLHRLLIESDGLDGIAWVRRKEAADVDYAAAMAEHLQTVAALRGLSPEAMLCQMEQNLHTFLK